MRYWIYLIIIIFIIPVQTVLLESVSIGGIRPDLGLIAVYFIGLIYGEVEGAVMGIIIGTIFDLFSGGYWGINFFGKSAIGFLAGYTSRNMLNILPLFNSGLIFVYSILEGIMISFLLILISRHLDILGLLTGTIIPQSVYNGVVGLFIYYLLFNKRSISSMRKFDFVRSI